MDNVTVAFVGATVFLTLATITATALKLKGKKRTRRYKVRPMNQLRTKEGLFSTLLKDMVNIENDEEQFFKYTRMSPSQFRHLLKLVKPIIEKDENKNPISPAERLVMTLHYLSEGCSMQEIAWGYRVGKATVHQIVKETCKAIWDVLSPAELSRPSESRWKRIASEFFKRWNIPNCVGAVDGKHIHIQAPEKSGSLFFNYKKSFSLVLMACCDAYYRFTLVDIGAYGSSHDSAVFKASSFGSALINGTLDLPPPVKLPKTATKMPYFMVGDAAFPLHTNLMRPYPGHFLDETKRTFNYRVSRGRRTIENTFGILVQRWRILRKPIIASINVAELIVQAIVVLHNFLQSSEINMPEADRKYCPTGLVDKDTNEERLPEMSTSTLQSVGRLGANYASKSVRDLRDLLAEYFISAAGFFEGQQNYIWRGGAPNV